MPFPSNEDIALQQQQIEDTEVNTVPLVSDLFPLQALEVEYENGEPVFLQKIRLLEEGYSSYRRCRGDGNCFFRAFSFRLMEIIGLSPDPTAHLTVLSSKILAHLQRAGFQPLAYEDFLLDSMGAMRSFGENAPILAASVGNPSDWLAQEWRHSPYASNSLVVLLRMVASAYLRQHAEEYLPFIWETTSGIQLSSDDPQQAMALFCQQFVEAFGVESDQIHIIALTLALGYRVQISYLDSSSPAQADIASSLFLEFGTEATAAQLEPITLLYRPGHYDIIYRKSFNSI